MVDNKFKEYEIQILDRMPIKKGISIRKRTNGNFILKFKEII